MWKPGKRGRGIPGVETAWAKDLAMEMTHLETARGQMCIECLPAPGIRLDPGAQYVVSTLKTGTA